MANAPNKRRVSVTIDADLLDAIDQFSDNRSAIIEEALRLWQAQQIEDQLRQFYQNRPQSDIQDETAWAQETQDATHQQWDEDGPWEGNPSA
jgi:Arc/MetJ-type ribon-helix-helix transcriptional regulator